MTFSIYIKQTSLFEQNPNGKKNFYLKRLEERIDHGKRNSIRRYALNLAKRGLLPSEINYTVYKRIEHLILNNAKKAGKIVSGYMKGELCWGYWVKNR